MSMCKHWELCRLFRARNIFSDGASCNGPSDTCHDPSFNFSMSSWILQKFKKLNSLVVEVLLLYDGLAVNIK